MDKNENKETIPFPKLLGWFDIAKGLGEVALDVLIHRHRPTEEHLTPVQKDADAWVSKIGFGND